MTEEEIQDIKYVLKFALNVIEENQLEDISNKDNWRLGKSLEESINKIDHQQQSHVRAPTENEIKNQSTNLLVNLENACGADFEDVGMALILTEEFAKWARDFNGSKEIKPNPFCENKEKYKCDCVLHCMDFPGHASGIFED